MQLRGFKAVSYLRVSGKGQLKGSGFDRQRQVIREFAKVHGVTIVEEFQDRGVSGTKEAVDRPGLSAMLERIAGNGVRLVLVEQSDRLSRDLIVGELLLAEFRKMGVQVIACSSGTDLAVDDQDPTKVLIRQVLGAFAQFEKSLIVSKLRAARDRKRRLTGKCEGPKVFGDLPGEQAAIDRIRQLNTKPRGGKRLSLGRIAKALDSEGICTRGGKPWRPQTVQSIITRQGFPR